MKFKNFVAQHKRAVAIWGILLAIFCIAASPSFQSFNSGQFSVIGNRVVIKVGSGQTGNVFYGTITLPTGQQLSDIIISNSVQVNDHGSNGIQINATGWNTTINDAALAFTLATWVQTNLIWTWNVTNVFQYPVTAPGFVSSAVVGIPGIISLSGTNGNNRVFNGGQSNLTYSGGSGLANSNINIDASSSDIFFLLVTNYTFISFTNLTCGQYGNVHLVMGNGGGWPVAFNTNWVRTNDVDSYTLKTNVGSYNVLGYLNGPYCTNTEVGIKRGF